MISALLTLLLILATFCGLVANIFLGLTWLWIVLGCTVAWLGVGIFTTVVLSQTPYGDNPWGITILLWPLFWYGIIFR